MSEQVVICEPVRTPIGRVNGSGISLGHLAAVFERVEG